METKKLKKLVLNKEVISSLDRGKMNANVGGGTTEGMVSFTCGITYASCPVRGCMGMSVDCSVDSYADASCGCGTGGGTGGYGGGDTDNWHTNPAQCDPMESVDVCYTMAIAGGCSI